MNIDDLISGLFKARQPSFFTASDVNIKFVPVKCCLPLVSVRNKMNLNAIQSGPAPEVVGMGSKMQGTAFFISGKFDPFYKNVPYSALTNALQGLVNQLLTGSEEALHHPSSTTGAT